MTEPGERIAVLEVQQSIMKEELDEIKVGIDSLSAGMLDVQKTLEKQRGFWTGVTFLASAIAFILSQAWAYLNKAGGS